MNLHLIAVGDKMPGWVNEGYTEYAKRLPPSCALRLVEVPAAKRSKHADRARILGAESDRLLAAVPKTADTIALEVAGQAWSTEQLSARMADWMRNGRDIALLVGGPDGLGEAARQRANTGWSLSPLTLPHPLVRILIAEQLYRAWSLLHNHPYHRT